LKPSLIVDKINNYNIKLAIGKKRIKTVQKDKLKKANMPLGNEFASQSLTQP